MIEQWQELKETITEMRDNDGTGTQQEVCKFLANLMNVLEKQMQEPKWISVSERYPSVEEQYNDFLVIDDAGRMSIQEFYLTLYDHQPFFSGCLNVVAWMPLPKPYEPQEVRDK